VTKIIAEVIESSTRQFVAEVQRDAEAPAFGTWVEVEEGDEVLYGLVSHVEIGSVEPGRQAMALGRTSDELRREMPHVLALLRTTFRAQVLGFARRGEREIRQTLPPRPADIHSFVRACADATTCRLGPPFDFLRTLVQSPDPAVPVDDLVVAAIRSHAASQEGDLSRRDSLVRAGRALSRLLGDDHERVQSILRRAR
jgi:hypothetical protein